MNTPHTNNDNLSFSDINKIAGGFVAWIIGAGFATGREILNFFASFGYLAYGAIIITLVGFIFSVKVVMEAGYEHRDNPDFRQYDYFCGKKIGKIYYIVVPVFLFLLMAILISATGSTIQENYGINRYIGSIIVAIIIFMSYISGFERFIQVISKVTPILIVFFILVGLIVIQKDYSNFSLIGDLQSILKQYKAGPVWYFSGFLYFSLAVSAGGTYISRLGASARSLKQIKYGSLLGSIEVCLAIAIISTAILLNIEHISKVDVPTLYLAQRIGPLVANAFTIVLLLGIFSASAATMWSLCKFMYADNPRKNKLAALLVAILATLVGVFPFAKLVAIILPIMAYIGMFYVVCVVYKGLRLKFKN